MHRCIALLLAATTSAVTAAHATAAPATIEPKRQSIAEVLPGWMQHARIPGVAVAYLRDGREPVLQVYGERAPGVPLTTDAVFNVASLAKPVFATLALHLVDEGVIGLDTPLAQHWVDPHVADDPRHEQLTARLALSHQSGLPNWRRETMEFAFAPGARHEYSGEGFEYVRRAIERATDEKLAPLMQRHVLAPAGMTSSWFGWSDAMADRLVTGYDEAGEPLDMAYLKQRGPNAAGNLLTTIGDYARFAQWVLDGADLPAPLYADMARPQAQHKNPVENFGLGWRVTRTDAGTVLSHDGRESGVRTQVFVSPATDEALVILTNSSHGELVVRPLVEATLSNATDLLHNVSLDIWHWLTRIPAEQLGPMQQGISRSPSFMSKLLYAADAGLVANAGLDAAERAAAQRAIDPYVRAMLDGRVTHEQAAEVIALLVRKEDSSPGLHQRFTPAQARAWVQALQLDDAGG